MPDIEIPNDWRCRPVQIPAWNYLNGGGKRAVLVWHRRLGKDALCLNYTAVSALTKRVGTYWHMLPEASQARKAIWNAVDEFTGIRRIDQAFPPVTRKNVNDNEMFLRFHNGSTWQVVGSDNYQSLLGSPPIGVVFSEFAYADPAAWQKISPILAANGGWAIFISTPNGRNHFSGLYEYAKTAPGWFAELLTVDDTKLFTAEQIVDEERQLASQRGIQEAQGIIRQEYYCSFDAAIPGTYYANVLEEMEKSTPTKMTNVPYDPGFYVETWWDLGIRDDTAIWFVQKIGREYRVIDYYETAGMGIDHYAQVLRGTAENMPPGDNERRRKYAYAHTACVLPHDAGHGQLTQRGGASLAQVLDKQYGFRGRVVPQTRSLQWSINQVRSFLPTCVFDKTICKDGIEKLRLYRRKWNDVSRSYNDTPFHDHTSHAADAFRTGVEGLTNAMQDAMGGVDYRPRRQYAYAIDDADPLGRDL